jgi:hypothetical protein
VQVFIISAINMLSSLAWALVALGLTKVSWMTLFLQYSWMCCHGVPPVLYLALNKTVRGDVLRGGKSVFEWFLLRMRKKSSSSLSTNAGVATPRHQQQQHYPNTNNSNPAPRIGYRNGDEGGTMIPHWSNSMPTPQLNLAPVDGGGGGPATAAAGRRY